MMYVWDENKRLYEQLRDVQAEIRNLRVQLGIGCKSCNATGINQKKFPKISDPDWDLKCPACGGTGDSATSLLKDAK